MSGIRATLMTAMSFSAMAGCGLYYHQLHAWNPRFREYRVGGKPDWELWPSGHNSSLASDTGEMQVITRVK